MASYQERVKQFDDLLNCASKIDLKSLKDKSYRGIPEGNGRRSLTWRILLGYLPLDRDSWPSVLQQKRALYKQFVEEIIVQTPETNSPVIEDHPLNPNPNSNWQHFFKDNEVLLQIDKDVRRLYPDISFFSQACEYPNPIVGTGIDRLHQRVNQSHLEVQATSRKGFGPSLLQSAPKKKEIEDYAPLTKGDEAHWEVVERILFIYAKLNPGQGYVQGMNEIIGPIYYVFATDSNTQWREHAEADCFFCFTNLMSDIRDFFIKTLDDSPTGIRMLMVKLDKMLESKDYTVHNILLSQGIKMPYFAFRWLSLMLSQEFSLPDVLSLWDALLTDDTRCELLMDVCIAMLKLVRNDLIHNDFATNMKLLQNYPGIDVRLILEEAKAIRS
eukprot:TRINITY_DN2566_c0_g1_i2.p1 TRINITY_DN2566_c0_g1~~TRINITY_DN2566_c0_g1_i2.p1  ORF type:complete len:385 (-),score=51.57 TRINITY_DN2566_c0_g1_i2:465-1619(-)